MMSKEDLFKWLESCPSHKWEVEYEDDDGYVSITFRTQEYDALEESYD